MFQICIRYYFQHVLLEMKHEECEGICNFMRYCLRWKIIQLLKKCEIRNGNEVEPVLAK